MRGGGEDIRGQKRRTRWHRRKGCTMCRRWRRRRHQQHCGAQRHISYRMPGGGWWGGEREESPGNTYTLVPSRFKTTSLVLHVPLWVIHRGNRSLLYPGGSAPVRTERVASSDLAVEELGMPGGVGIGMATTRAAPRKVRKAVDFMIVERRVMQKC